jgi:hypothetical protein
MTLAELWLLFPIELVQHNSEWAVWYAEEESALSSLLGDIIQRLDHIGSTAVQGLDFEATSTEARDFLGKMKE